MYGLGLRQLQVLSPKEYGEDLSSSPNALWHCRDARTDVTTLGQQNVGVPLKDTGHPESVCHGQSGHFAQRYSTQNCPGQSSKSDSNAPV